MAIPGGCPISGLLAPISSLLQPSLLAATPMQSPRGNFLGASRAKWWCRVGWGSFEFIYVEGVLCRRKVLFPSAQQ